MKPKIHVSTGAETQILAVVPDDELGPDIEWRGIARGPSQLAWRLGFPEAKPAVP